jgi:hypothetical protein
MNRDGRKDREERGIGWNLEREINGFLQGHRDQTGDRSDAQPVRGAGGLERSAHVGEIESDRRDGGNADQEAAFRRELKIIVVRLCEMDRCTSGLV